MRERVRSSASQSSALQSSALQSEVLESLSDAWQYRRWLTGLALRHLGDSPLEIGSGLGCCAEEFARHVPRFTASEAAPDRLVRLKERFADRPGITVRELLLPTEEVGDYSAAVAMNVLEHIPDDVGAVLSMARLVRPGGAVVLLVPAHQVAMSRFDRSIGHLRRYSRASLGGVLRDAGLVPSRLQYINAIGLLSWVLLVRGLGVTPRNGPLVRAFDRLLVPAARRLERRIAPPFGQSLFAVAHTATR